MDRSIILREIRGFGVLAISVRAPVPLGTLLASSVTGQSCPFMVIVSAVCERDGKRLGQRNRLLSTSWWTSPCCR